MVLLKHCCPQESCRVSLTHIFKFTDIDPLPGLCTRLPPAHPKDLQVKPPIYKSLPNALQREQGGRPQLGGPSQGHRTGLLGPPLSHQEAVSQERAGRVQDIL